MQATDSTSTPEIKDMNATEIDRADGLAWHNPDGRFDLTLQVKDTRSNVLYEHRRRTTGELLEVVKQTREKGKYPLPHWTNIQLPLDAPLPPATDAGIFVRVGGNEGYKAQARLLDEKDRSGPFSSQVNTYVLWTEKYLQDPKPLAKAVNDQLWDLGRREWAEERFTHWLEQGRYEGEVADRLDEIRGLKSTESVRHSRDSFEWGRQIQIEIEDLSRRIGWDAAREILGLPEGVSPPGAHVPGRDFE